MDVRTSSTPKADAPSKFAVLNPIKMDIAFGPALHTAKPTKVLLSSATRMMNVANGAADTQHIAP